MSFTAVVLGLCQFLFMAAVAVGISFNALVGKALAPSTSMATVPFLFLMGSTASLTLLMPRILAQLGYRITFLVGAGAGLVGGLLATVAIFTSSFAVFCIAAVFMGLYQASAMYYRFAAADAVSAEKKSNAMAWVLNGGIIAALLGPLIGSRSLHLLSFDYSGSYAAAAILAFCAIPLLIFVPLPARTTAASQYRFQFRDLNAQIIQAIIFCAVGYLIMGMIMLASPLAMSGCGYHAADAASVIQWHLLGMFLPSLLTGKLITRFSPKTVALMGMGILAIGCTIALSGQALSYFHIALMVVGIGWNFMYMGGSVMLAQIKDVQQRSKIQSINEFVTFFSITLMSGLTGWIYASFGWIAVLIIGLALLSVIILIVLTGNIRTKSA